MINAEVQLLNCCFDDIEETIQLMRNRPEKNRRRSSAMNFGTLNKSHSSIQRRGSKFFSQLTDVYLITASAKYPYHMHREVAAP